MSDYSQISDISEDYLSNEDIALNEDKQKHI